MNTGDPNWQAKLEAALPLTDAELAEVVDDATPCAETGAPAGPDAPSALRMAREIQEARRHLAAVRAYLKACDEYDRELLTSTRGRQVELAGARSDTFVAMREALR